MSVLSGEEKILKLQWPPAGTSHLTASTLLQSKQREESDLASGHWNNYLNTFQYLAPCTLHYNKHHVSLNFTHKQNANERMIF